MLTRLALIAALAVLPSLGACTSWRPAAVGPAELLETESPESIRVARADGTAIVMDNPRLEGDSIVGAERECRTAAGPRPGGRTVCYTGEKVGVSIADTEGVEVRATSGTSTGFGVVGGVLLAVGVALYAVVVSVDVP